MCVLQKGFGSSTCPPPLPVGPWPTFEIQLPQDDFHFLAWHFGEQIAPNDLSLSRTTYHFRGLDSEETLLSGKDWVDKSLVGGRQGTRLVQIPTDFLYYTTKGPENKAEIESVVPLYSRVAFTQVHVLYTQHMLTHLRNSPMGRQC